MRSLTHHLRTPGRRRPGPHNDRQAWRLARPPAALPRQGLRHLQSDLRALRGYVAYLAVDARRLGLDSYTSRFKVRKAVF